MYLLLGHVYISIYILLFMIPCIEMHKLLYTKKSPSQLSSCYAIPPLANSDHLGLHLSLTIAKNSHHARPAVKRKLWRYNQADFDKAAEMINSSDWNALLTDN